MLVYILFGLSALVSLGFILYLYAKLTPNVIPANLAGFFAGILWTALFGWGILQVITFLLLFFGL